MILKPIEERLRDVTTRQEKLPVELIFRRAHPEDFAAIEAALDVSEDDAESIPAAAHSTDNSPPPDEQGEDPISWLWGLLAAPLAALKRRYLEGETNR
jgi:hypothetical protein